MSLFSFLGIVSAIGAFVGCVIGLFFASSAIGLCTVVGGVAAGISSYAGLLMLTR